MTTSRSTRSRRTQRRKGPGLHVRETPENWIQDKNGNLATNELRTIEFASLSAIFDLASKSPIQALYQVNGACTTLASGYHEHLRKSLAAIYAVGFYIISDERIWREFINLPESQAVKRRPSNDTKLRHTLRFVLKYAFSGSPTTNNTLSRYYIALQGLFNKRVKPEKVRRMLMRDGPEKMYERERDRMKAAARLEAQKKSFDELNENVQGSAESTPAGEDPNCKSDGGDELLGLMSDLLSMVVKVAAIRAKRDAVCSG